MPAGVARGWDHTYVASSCGLRWGCFGRSVGGASICRGPGNSVVANCLSQVNGRAGIRYLITGVCHQAANRILHPAFTTVARARGYKWSHMRYGVYGIPPWPQRAQCYQPPIGGTSPSSPGATGSGVAGGPSASASDPFSDYDKSVTLASESGMDDDKVRLADLAALVQLGLGKPLDDATFAQLADIQYRLQIHQNKLVYLLDEGQISPEQYLDKLNRLSVDARDRGVELLGYANFKAIFGDVGDTIEELGDTEAFLEEYRTK
jgi:hypothetical protein